MSDDSHNVGQATIRESTEPDEEDVEDVLGSADRLQARRNHNRQIFNRRRVDLLDDLILNLDMLVYAELSTIYYLDCYLVRFLIRAVIQFIFLTPKASMFPAPPKPEPFVGAILGTNLLCLILHIFSRAPAASEATRGYLHGGVVIDVIGQKGPTSKLLLIALDLLVVSIQLVHLSAHIARTTLKDGVSAGRVGAATLAQDLDSEERGVRRSGEMQQQQSQDFAMQNLDRNGRAMHVRSEEAETLVTPRTDAFLFDAFKNGQIVIADLNPLKTAKEQVIRFQKTPPELRRSALNAHLTGRLYGLRMLGIRPSEA